jgi:NAD-dependent SIR2 family protein deacetylase
VQPQQQQARTQQQQQTQQQQASMTPLKSLAPDAAKVTRSQLEALTAFAGEAKRLLLLTGAGVSTHSGIPDYRSPNGSYSKGHKPMQHGEFVQSEAARRRYWARSYVGFGFFARARPNAAHVAAAALEARSLLAGGVVTQNVDGLHQAAGSRAVLDLHGRIDIVECLGCGSISSRQRLQDRLAQLNGQWLSRLGLSGLATAAAARADGDAELTIEACAGFDVPRCEACGSGLLKPGVTFFGGSVPALTVEAARAAVESADAVLIAGSSVQTFSAFRLVKQAAAAGKPVGLLSIGPSRADPVASLKIESDAADVLPALVGALCGNDAEQAVRRAAAHAAAF